MTTEYDLTAQKYPMQCAICGVVWDRKKSDIPPPPASPHDHTQADWNAYYTTNGLTPDQTHQWIKIAGETYPDLPPWPPEMGSPPAARKSQPAMKAARWPAKKQEA